MSAKIGEELSQQLKDIEEASEEELPVIITVKEGANLAALKEKGLKVQHTFDIINAVSGTLPAAAIRSVARLAEVQHIDYDGEVQALKKKGDSE